MRGCEDGGAANAAGGGDPGGASGPVRQLHEPGAGGRVLRDQLHPGAVGRGGAPTAAHNGRRPRGAVLRRRAGSRTSSPARRRSGPGESEGGGAGAEGAGRAASCPSATGGC